MKISEKLLDQINNRTTLETVQENDFVKYEPADWDDKTIYLAQIAKITRTELHTKGGKYLKNNGMNTPRDTWRNAYIKPLTLEVLKQYKLQKLKNDIIKTIEKLKAIELVEEEYDKYLNLYNTIVKVIE